MLLQYIFHCFELGLGRSHDLYLAIFVPHALQPQQSPPITFHNPLTHTHTHTRPPTTTAATPPDSFSTTTTPTAASHNGRKHPTDYPISRHLSSQFTYQPFVPPPHPTPTPPLTPIPYRPPPPRKFINIHQHRTVTQEGSHHHLAMLIPPLLTLPFKHHHQHIAFPHYSHSRHSTNSPIHRSDNN